VEVSAKQIGTPLNVRSCGFCKNLRERKDEVLAFRMAFDVSEFKKTFAFRCAAPPYCQ
jgi:hypothetical protein